MIFAVVLSCCMSSLCVGAFAAFWVEIKRSRIDTKFALDKAEEVTKHFINEHNAMAKRVVELSDTVNGIKMASGLNRVK